VRSGVQCRTTYCVEGDELRGALSGSGRDVQYVVHRVPALRESRLAPEGQAPPVFHSLEPGRVVLFRIAGDAEAGTEGEQHVRVVVFPAPVHAEEDAEKRLPSGHGANVRVAGAVPPGAVLSALDVLAGSLGRAELLGLVERRGEAAVSEDDGEGRRLGRLGEYRSEGPESLQRLGRVPDAVEVELVLGKVHRGRHELGQREGGARGGGGGGRVGSRRERVAEGEPGLPIVYGGRRRGRSGGFERIA